MFSSLPTLRSLPFVFRISIKPQSRRDSTLKALHVTHHARTLARSLCRYVKTRRRRRFFVRRRRRRCRRPPIACDGSSALRLSPPLFSPAAALFYEINRICGILALLSTRSRAVERHSMTQRGRERDGRFLLVPAAKRRSGRRRNIDCCFFFSNLFSSTNKNTTGRASCRGR